MIDQARWQKLSPFLDQALEREGAEREGWIETLRADHAEVAQDLQSLLGELQALDDRGFLQSDPSSAMLSEPSRAGQTLGAYTLESLLGRGGMGTVWLARRHDGHFECKVAVKLLNLALLGLDGGQERLRREARVLGRLAHLNIARIIDAGLTTTGQLYLVLEYVEGCDIERYCDEQSLTIEARIQLFLDVLAAVGHAHANLIVHRDIKPANIYVTRQGVVKLLDFGAAKLIEGGDPESATPLPREGVRALTPQYAAPEQMLDAPITVATDVYALGVLLYVLLSGQHPTGEKSASTLQHMRSLLEAEPARLSEAATAARTYDPATLAKNAAKRAATPQRLKRVLRGDLDNIVAKALQKNPQERYASVREFADDLKRYLHDEPVLARADSAFYRVRKFVVRNRLPVILGGTALAAILAIAATIRPS